MVHIDEETGAWEILSRTAGLPSDYLYTLLNTGTSGQPTLWIATTGGLARLDSTRWHTIDSRSGLPSDTVVGAGETAFPDGRTSYWVGTTNGTVRLGPSGWELYRPLAGGPSPVVFDMTWTLEKQERVFWLATAQGLFRHTGGTWSLALPPIDAYFLRTVPTPDGDDLWAGSVYRLRRHSGGHWPNFLPGDGGLPGREITALQSLTTGSRGTLWAGTDAGAAEWTGDRWQPEAAPCLPHPEVLALYPSANSAGDGWLWLGAREGVARMRLAAGRVVPGSCQALTKDHHSQLKNAQIVQILSDAEDRIYLFSDQGVFRLAAPTGGSLETTRLEAFDTEDGLPGIHFTRASFVDHQGRIWSGSAAGIALFDPRHELRHSASVPPAPLRIERLLVDGQERPLAPGFELRPQEKRLTIEFALLSFEREHAIRFRTQLSGLDAQPGAWSRETHISYDRLPPGAYTLKVWGRNGEGTVSGPATLGFRVLPPVWRAPWAFALYALAAGGLGTVVVRLRVRSLARRAAHLEELVAERTHELAEANHRLELASFTDPLTGLQNRRFLAATIQPDMLQAIRNHRDPPGDPLHRDLVVYLLDLDHFKRLNDRAGHDAGDAVLVEIARRLRQTIRASDLAVRWGGEEILVISRWTDRAAGALLAERLLEAVGGRPFRIGVDRTVPVTVSIGWAPFPWSGEDPEAVLFEEVLSLADHALYLAKRNGRNRSVGALPGGSPAEEVVERILREDVSLHALEGVQVELVWSAGPEVAAADLLDTTPRLRGPAHPAAQEAGDAPPPL
ncbi:MAG TPA: hypothetical protein DD490_35270 [Acidobacteria bacterium]|nr:hypothetical protein [Acidobacteriota bacterium]